MFDLYLRGAEYVICCDNKPLDQFLSKGIKIPEINGWSLESADYNIMFVYIKGKNDVLLDAISRLKTLNIYKEPLENPKTSAFSTVEENVMEICASDMHTVGTSMLCTEQK